MVEIQSVDLRQGGDRISVAEAGTADELVRDGNSAPKLADGSGLDANPPDSNDSKLAEITDVPVPDTTSCPPACTAKTCADDTCDEPCGNCPQPGACELGDCILPGGECDDSNEVPWDGCTAGCITERLVNETTCGDQVAPAVSGMDDGFVVVWENRSLSDPVALRGRLFDNSGAPSGAELVLAQSETKSHSQPDVAAFTDGGFVVVWTQASSLEEPTQVLARSFQASGVPTGNQYVVNEYPAHWVGHPSISTLSNGSYLVAWESCENCFTESGFPPCPGQDGDGCGIIARHFTHDGLPVGTEFVVNSDAKGEQTEPFLTKLSDDSFAVVWESHLGTLSDLGVFGRVVSAVPAPDGQFQLNSHVGSLYGGPKAAGLANGQIVAVWASCPCGPPSDSVCIDEGEEAGQDGHGCGVFSQLFDNSGNNVGAETQINVQSDGDQSFPAVAGLDGGSYAVVWASHNAVQDGSSWGVFGRVRDGAQGGTSSDEFQVNVYELARQTRPEVAALSSGGFVVVWVSRPLNSDPSPTAGQDGWGAGVFSQVFNDGGQRVVGWE